MALKPWREVIVPHEDVLEGSYQEAEFAADLTKVVMGVASPEYQDPVRFFERTVITEGMSLLLQSVVKRLAGKGGDPVVQLQTAFGGGKTHTMMAVLHVASGKAAPDKLVGVPQLLKKAKVAELVPARVAVLDGNALSPSHAREHGAIRANTLWGELAYQIGGADGYARVEASDKDGTSPGKDILVELFRAHGPVVVLMDETVAYLRQLERGKSYRGGTFNSNLSFLQALTEAASMVPRAMILASLPESTMEIGDEVGHQVLDAVQKLFGRVEAVWKPVATEEAFEIVRRRLFGPVQDEAARDEVVRAFAELYRSDGDKFPAETRDSAYLRRLKASYPLHPEVFERLYEDWSTLPKFQRTRGVLRLVARLAHSLWRENNKDFLILPGSIPLDDVTVRNELVKFLPAGWDPIVDKDIDGQNAEPRRIDDSTPALGSIQACRRAARTIFLGSAPSVTSQKVRGIGIERVRLGCAQPGQAVGKYDDALRRLGDRLHYLYSGNDRFWFDLRTNLRREMEDRMQRFDEALHIFPAIQTRIEKQVKSELFTAIHVFRQHHDIPDKVELRLVVLDPGHAHKRKDSESKAVRAATEILQHHGERQREFQNRVLFLAADGGAIDALCDHVRRFLAWESIVDDVDRLNLDRHNETEAKKELDEAKKRVDASVRETYRFLLAPSQEADSGAPGPVQWEDEALALAGSTYEKAIASTVHDKEWIIRAWAPTHLATILKRWFWRDVRPSVGTEKVWLDSCRYLYLPRLLNRDVFLRTVSDGVQSTEWFGYASAENAPGDFDGLVLGKASGIYLDNQSVFVRPDAAEAALKKLAAVKPRESATGAAAATPGASGGGTGKQATGGAAAKPVYRRFHGTIDLDAADPIGSFTALVQNVVEHMAAVYGTDVAITVDIEARQKNGFDAKVVRVVKENANTLMFRIAEFEEQ